MLLYTQPVIQIQIKQSTPDLGFIRSYLIYRWL